MKKSIKSDLFILFAVMMITFVLCGILLNIFMLEKYYIYKNKEIFNSIATEVSSVLSEGDVQRKIEEIDRSEGISITIANKEMQNIYTSFSTKKTNERLPKEIETLIKETKINIKEIPTYSIVKKQNDSQSKLIYIIMTKTDDYIILTKPMKGIQESVSIANQFYVMAGIVALISGSIFMFRFSDKVTKPIIEMSKIAKDMSELNFDKKLNIQLNSELSTLAQSINTLSYKLEENIKNLKNDIEFQKSLSRNMSHELKTPIGIIKGYSEGLLFDVADNPEMRNRYLNTITCECDRMDELIKNMLMFSRLSAKDYVLSDITKFSSDILIHDIIERFSYDIKSNNIIFVYECIEPVIIKGNYGLILQAVTNLISNAFRYCDKHKYVSLNITNTDLIEIKIFNSCNGIPENEMQKIFDEFYRIDKTRSRESGGHGLGLSIVRTIALLHKGDIMVKNTQGGVEFILTISKIL